MATSKEWNILFIKDERSMFDDTIKKFDALFGKVDRALGKEEAINCFESNKYDIVIADLSVKPELLGMLKQVQDIKSNQEIFALVSPKDTKKLYGIADLGINAFELLPEQFEQALEMIAQMNFNEEGKLV